MIIPEKWLADLAEGGFFLAVWLGVIVAWRGLRAALSLRRNQRIDELKQEIRWRVSDELDQRGIGPALPLRLPRRPRRRA